MPTDRSPAGAAGLGGSTAGPSTGPSSADVPVPLDEVLEGAQLAQADRSARVQLLGRVSDLRAHPELAAVGEARGGVHIHAGRVHAELEGPGGSRVARDDRLGVSAAVAADVLDRLLHRVDNANGEGEAEVLARPVILLRHLKQRG